MRAGFHRAPVVAGRDHHRVEPVHQALVVRGGAVRIALREARRAHDAVADFLAAEAVARERAGRDAALDAHAALVAEVGENAQPQGAAAQLEQARRDAFGHGVDQVRAHRVAAVYEQVHHQHAVAEIAWLQPAHAAAALDQPRHARVADRAQLAFVPAHAVARSRGVGHLVELHLRDHDGRIGLALEAAAFADHLRRVARGGDHRRFLDHHRHDVVDVVDLDVERERERERERADHVLDDLVRGRRLETAVQSPREIRLADA
jgi:hypothetical protein